MDAKLTIHFKRQPDGSHLATAVMLVAGNNQPKYYRVKLAEGVDPWSMYNEVAAQAVGYILAHKEAGADKEKPAGAGGATAGKLVQLRGVLPT